MVQNDPSLLSRMTAQMTPASTTVSRCNRFSLMAQPLSGRCRRLPVGMFLVTMPPFLKEVAIPEQRPNGKTKKAGDSYDDNTKPSEQSVTIPYDKILQRYIMSTTKSPAWIGVISTTGVYGDHNGQWVDELSKCLCSEDSSAADYLRWEQLWQNFGREHSSRVAIFRCAGIYGSTRSSLHTLYKRGAMSPKNQVSAPSSSSPSLSITNRIHEDDLTASVVASMLINMADAHECTTNNVEIYNLSDNLPESRQVVFDYAKQLFASRNITIPAQSTTPPQKANKRSVRRRQEVKRVCNQKMRSQLLSELKFPTYKEGLAHILDQPSTPWSDQGLF